MKSINSRAWILCLLVPLALLALPREGNATWYTHKIPDCQMPYPIYYNHTYHPTGCDVSLIQQAIDIFNQVARDNELPYDFFYYAGQTTNYTVLCDCGSGNNACDYKNGMNQIVWKCPPGYSSVARMCYCQVGSGYEMDVLMDPDHVTCGEPDEDHLGALSTILHELGHVLGLPDNPTGCQDGSIMDYGGNLDTLTQCDKNMLLQIYNCTWDDSCCTISGVNVTTTFYSSTYTWQATVAFTTNFPTTAKVYYDPSMDCYPTCSYSHVQAGPTDVYTLDHSIVLSNLAPSTTYCYKIEAYPNPVASGLCKPTHTGTFNLTNAYSEIYDITHDFSPVINKCRIYVDWKTKFPSKNNKLYWMISGDDTWNYVEATEDNCASNRSYSAYFPVASNTSYDFQVSTKINGVTYYSSVLSRTTGQCGGPYPVGEPEKAARPLLVVSPNPANPTTTISFTVLAASDVDLVVYSVDGRFVKTIAAGHLAQGTYSEQWNGTNANGEQVASGIYLVRLRVGAETYTSKVVFVR